MVAFVERLLHVARRSRGADVPGRNADSVEIVGLGSGSGHTSRHRLFRKTEVVLDTSQALFLNGSVNASVAENGRGCIVTVVDAQV